MSHPRYHFSQYRAACPMAEAENFPDDAIAVRNGSLRVGISVKSPAPNRRLQPHDELALGRGDFLGG
jgi:hypothetical protein